MSGIFTRLAGSAAVNWIVEISIPVALFIVAIVPGWWAISTVEKMSVNRQSVVERWSLAEHADSISMAAQRSSGAVGVNSAGDSIYAVVHVPSGRPIELTANRQQRFSTRPTGVLRYAGIPLSLLLIAGAWFAHHRYADED